MLGVFLVDRAMAEPFLLVGTAPAS